MINLQPPLPRHMEPGLLSQWSLKEENNYSSLIVKVSTIQYKYHRKLDFNH